MGLKAFFTIFHSSVWKYCKWIADRADHTNKGVTSAATCGENITEKVDSFQKARLGGGILHALTCCSSTSSFHGWQCEFQCGLRNSVIYDHQLLAGISWHLDGSYRESDTQTQWNMTGSGVDQLLQLLMWKQTMLYQLIGWKWACPVRT